jgi:sugar/nucleoside kinase (ribokinase family)
MGRRSSVLAIGSVYLDINATGFPFESGFPAEKEIVGGHYEAVLGGSAANFSKTIAALGASPILIGKTGDDAIGHLLTNMMIRHGIRPALVRSKAVSNLGINSSIAMVRDVLVLGTANQSLRPREGKQT